MSNAVSLRKVRLAREFASHASNPFVQLILRIRQNETPTYEVTSDGLELISDGLTEHEHAMIKECETQIKYIHERALRHAGAIN